jgi:polysaccharide deacetylase family protein (PEP-CTERM system associated)
MIGEMTTTGVRKHLLTVSVEDYFQSGALNGVIARKHWTRIESRLEKSIQAVISLLEEHQVKATFFVLGWIADRQPEIVRLIRAAGHEIGSRGYWKGMPSSPQQLREELHRAKEALEGAGSNRIFGYRYPQWITRPEGLWILDVLASEGYDYSSSVAPIWRRFATHPGWTEARQYHSPSGGASIWEFPVSTMNVLGFRVPIAGGNYLRQLPHRILSQEVEQWNRSRKSPVLFYLFPWELDDEQPQVQGISLYQQVRHYRRIGKPRHVFRKYFAKYQFQPIGDYLGLPWRTAPVDPPKARAPIEIRTGGPARDLLPVTLVVPLYNEEANVPYLYGNIVDLKRRLERRFRIHFLFVDDGSTDATVERLRSRFSDFPDCRIIRHAANGGVAAAILTGVRDAPSEIVASIDCDCSYDPGELEEMIPMIESADLVTASPYHPRGTVLNVPPWRLFLSRTLSSWYSLLLGNAIHTYTSCFRVYRKGAIESVPIKHGGFLGVAEMLIRLRLRGGCIVEFPTTLESRLFGESKMKIVRTIFSHLGLLWELVVLRLRGKGPPPVPAAAPRLPQPLRVGELPPAPHSVPGKTPNADFS